MFTFMKRTGACCLLFILSLITTAGIAGSSPISAVFETNRSTITFDYLATGHAYYRVSVNSSVTPKSAALTLKVTQLPTWATQQTAEPSQCSGHEPVCAATFALSAGQSCCLMLALGDAQLSAGNYSLSPYIQSIPAVYGISIPAVTVKVRATAPGAPTDVTATASSHKATVHWKAPTNTGGAPIKYYSITALGGGSPKTTTVSGDVLTTEITGLKNGRPYTFNVRAINSHGQRSPAGTSGGVIPQGAIYVGTTSGNVYTSTDSGANWSLFASTPNNIGINSVFFNGNTLYVGANDGNVYYSNAAGALTPALTKPDGTAVGSVFVSGTAWYVGTLGSIPQQNPPGKVFLSTDSGASWTQVGSSSPDNSSVNSVFLSGTTLYAGTAGGKLEILTNGSGTWTASTTAPSTSAVTSVFIGSQPIQTADYSTWYASTSTSASVKTSIDTGGSWQSTRPVSETDTSPIQSVFASGSSLYAATKDNNIYLSPDNGTIWNLFSSPNAFTGNLTGLFVNSTTLYQITLYQQLSASVDNGQSWTGLGEPLGTTPVSVFVSGTTVYVGTTNGTIYSTTDNYNWTALTTISTYPIIYSIYVNGTTIYASTNTGYVYYSTNGGTSWTATSQPDGSSVQSIYVSGTTLYAGTANGNVEISTNNGSTWTATTQPDGSSVSGVAVNGPYLYAATYNGNVYYSQNNGISWTATSRISGVPIYALCVYGNALYVGDVLGDLFTSQDNGLTWQPLTPIGGGSVLSLYMSNFIFGQGL